MKIILFITCMVLTPFLCQAQTADSKGILGVAINSSMNGEIYPFRLVQLLRRHGQVSVKVFDYLAKQVAIVIPLTAPSMRRTRCKRKVEVLALFNQFFS
jgi:hypothetical protein